MVHFEIINPTIAHITGTSDELISLRKQLSYKDLSAVFALKKHKARKWLERKDPEHFKEETERLEGEVEKCLIFNKNGKICTYPGIISYITIPYTVSSSIEYPKFKPLKWKKAPKFEPYAYQKDSVENLLNIKHGHISLPTGCHKKGQLILMFDGSLKKVEDIVVGDKIMGPDETSRTVQELARGVDDMYEITPNIGESFIVNSGHILSLKSTNLKKIPKYKSEIGGKIVNISVSDFVKKSKYFKHIHKLYRCKINNFQNSSESLPLDPYLLGLWLGDGNSGVFTITNIDKEIVEYMKEYCEIKNLLLKKTGKISYRIKSFNTRKGCTSDSQNNILRSLGLLNNKHIPNIYKLSSVAYRRELLAGILDSDGHLGNGFFEISQKNKKLFDDIVFLCRSLGFGVNTSEFLKYAANTVKKTKRTYYRAFIRGDFTDIPTKIPRKKVIESKLNRDPKISGFKISKVGRDDYYGFRVDKDNLYVMGDFTVTHNSGKSYILQLLTKAMGLKVVISTPSQTIFSELMKLFEDSFGKEMVGGYGDGKKCISKPITIAINKSLSMLKEGTPAYNFFASKEAVCFDESHVLSSEELSRTCHGALSDIPYRFFVSATQTRSDGSLVMLRSIIGPCVYQMSIKEAMDQNFLCPLKFKIIKTFSPSTLFIDDPIECKREHFLRNTNIADLAARIANASWTVKQESTLILVEELGQIQMLQKRLTVPFTYVHSGSKKDAEAHELKVVDAQEEIERFNRGEVRVLIGTRSIATGVNFYCPHNTVNFVGGNSEVIVKQGPMGRSTRKLENSMYKDFHKPKPFTTIFDFEVQGQKILNNQLKKRIEFYEETGTKVVY